MTNWRTTISGLLAAAGIGVVLFQGHFTPDAVEYAKWIALLGLGGLGILSSDRQ